MKAVLISLNPKWCVFTAEYKKRVEIRKTKPKLKTPFKVLIYCTQSKTDRFYIDNGEEYTHIGNGKVIGEFICDEITNYTKAFFDEQETRDTDEIAELLDLTCLTYSELCAYVGLKDFYGWHISDLKIYDKPRALSEFEFPKDYIYQSYRKRDKHFKGITRPPQSWCYVDI